MKELYWKCYHKIKRVRDFFLYDIKHGTRNLINWFPIIWNDRDWDQYYIFEVLRHKLQNTEKCIRNGNFVSCEKEADNIRFCCLLLNRIIKDDYYYNASKAFSKKWGKSKFEFTDVLDNPKLQEVKIKYENDPDNRHEEERRKEHKRIIDHENYLKDQDLDMLFSKMRKHILKWWD